ncbi:MAG: saccharopine dehydrogenase NADP-binding domain-containing protein [Deltaproteobacteria bacterium]|nr:saccharopine dehydrogenase NADP-binding domain-containing protein [Deltaproteobacteria bacterium]
MKKTVIVMGTGAQGGTIAMRLNEEPNVEKIICADYDLDAAKRYEKMLDKAVAVKVDASNPKEIVAASEGAELIVNGLPPDFNAAVMEAALARGMHYQDMASGPVADIDFVGAVKRQLALDDKFKAAGLSALINTGSAPGLVNVIARNAADKLDQPETIDIYIYDGIWTNRFIPFWWSPETAFGDMAAEPIRYENGEYKKVPPFNNPEMIDFKGLGPRRMVDHEHEEPVTFGLFFKGLKRANFKYGGPACNMAESFYKMGLLGTEPVEVNGSKIVPLDLVCRLTPPAPSDPDTIREALSEGMALEEGASLVRVKGQKNGQPVCLDNYINAPGLTEAFEKYGITHESFVTGQSAFLFTKLFVNAKIDIRGVFPPEVLEVDAREYYLKEAAALGITVDEIVETRLY